MHGTLKLETLVVELKNNIFNSWITAHNSLLFSSFSDF
jgi:hypothetical protein